MSNHQNLLDILPIFDEYNEVSFLQILRFCSGLLQDKGQVINNYLNIFCDTEMFQIKKSGPGHFLTSKNNYRRIEVKMILSSKIPPTGFH